MGGLEKLLRHKTPLGVPRHGQFLSQPTEYLAHVGVFQPVGILRLATLDDLDLRLGGLEELLLHSTPSGVL